MSSSTDSLRIMDVHVTAEHLTVELSDGRRLSAPIAWYPRLHYARPKERNKWRLIALGQGISWPEVDEDISLDNLLMGQPSGESQRSLKAWLDRRGVSGRPKSIRKRPRIAR